MTPRRYRRARPRRTMGVEMRKMYPTVGWVAAVWLVLAGIGLGGQARAQVVVDEARQAGRAAQTFPAADEDYFRDMDGGIPLTPDEVKGRNMWQVWTGGNDRLWDKLTDLTFGEFDLLKILSSIPASNTAATTAGIISGWST